MNSRIITNATKPLTVIGRTAELTIASEGGVRVPAKIDTGADASAIWASEIDIGQSGELSFSLFAKGSEFYSGKRHTTRSFDATSVVSAHGTRQVRYRVQLVVRISGKRVRATFTLADRSNNTYPVLIGCRLLHKKFLVDVSKGYHNRRGSRPGPLTKELRKDPRKFFQKYHAQNQRGDLEL